MLDVLCELENGEECNIEVQKADDDDHQKRVRYNTSCVTANITEPGSKFKFPRVSNRKKQFKDNEGGNEEVCDLVENYARERAEEAAKKAAEEAAKKAAEEAANSAKRLFENGASYELVKASLTSLSDTELKNIYVKVKGENAI